MEIFNINCGTLKLDAGAMFGVVPKAMWSKVYESDENNLANLAMRSLLIKDGNKLILIDTGAGDKLDDKLKKIYKISDNNLFRGIRNNGFKEEDITDVILTHLHFDHCGGATRYIDNKLKPSFPNAKYHISKSQWESANDPVIIEKASFFKENFTPIEGKGQLQLFEKPFNLTSNINIELFYGHTKGLAVPFINYKNKKIVYISDLIPLMPQINPAWICAYDNQPLVSIKEKQNILEQAYNEEWIIFSEHDYYNEACTIGKNEKVYFAKEFFKLEKVINV